jgi:hypothetical protein
MCKNNFALLITNNWVHGGRLYGWRWGEMRREKTSRMVKFLLTAICFQFLMYISSYTTM